MMKLATVTITLLAIILSSRVVAQSRPFETVDEAKQRQNAERYDAYQSRGYQAPLGGYSERLGDPAPRGTLSPGYVPPPPTYYPKPTIDYQGPPSIGPSPLSYPGLESVGPKPLGR